MEAVGRQGLGPSQYHPLLLQVEWEGELGVGPASSSRDPCGLCDSWGGRGQTAGGLETSPRVRARRPGLRATREEGDGGERDEFRAVCGWNEGV